MKSLPKLSAEELRRLVKASKNILRDYVGHPKERANIALFVRQMEDKAAKLEKQKKKGLK